MPELKTNETGPAFSNLNESIKEIWAKKIIKGKASNSIKESRSPTCNTSSPLASAKLRLTRDPRTQQNKEPVYVTDVYPICISCMYPINSKLF